MEAQEPTKRDLGKCTSHQFLHLAALGAQDADAAGTPLRSLDPGTPLCSPKQTTLTPCTIAAFIRPLAQQVKPRVRQRAEQC